MTSSLDGRVAIVSGARSGIGLAVTLELLEQGAAVVGFARSTLAPEVAARLERFGERFRYLSADQTTDEGREQVVTCAESLGGIHLLVNNAGGSVIGVTTPLVNQDEAQIRSILELNLVSPLLLSQRVARVMHGQASGGGVINISSTASLSAAAGLVAYGTAKAGLNQLTACLAREWGPHVRVNCLILGTIETDTLRNEVLSAYPEEFLTASVPLQRLGRPIEIAKLCAFLASDEAAYVNGTRIIVDGGRHT